MLVGIARSSARLASHFSAVTKPREQSLAHAGGLGFRRPSVGCETLESRGNPGGAQDHEVVLLERQGQEVQAVLVGHSLDGDPPIGAALCDRRGHGIVAPRLEGVPGGSSTLQQSVDQNPRAAALIAIDHQALGIGEDLAQ